MDINKICTGTRIKICDDPSESIKRWKGSECKHEMAGTVQQVSIIKKDISGIYAVRVRYKKQLWTFATCDFTIIKPKPEHVKPELFNPESLMSGSI